MKHGEPKMANHLDDAYDSDYNTQQSPLGTITPKDFIKGEEYRLYLLNKIHMERDREFRAEQKRWEETENQHVSIQPTFQDYLQAYNLELSMLCGAGTSIILVCLISLL